MTPAPLTDFYIIILAFAAGTLVALTLVKFLCGDRLNFALKIVAIALGVVGTFAYQSGVDAIDGAYYGHEIAGLAMTNSRGAITLQWLLIAATIFTVIYPFLFQGKRAAGLINLFAAGVFIANAALIGDLLTSTCGHKMSLRAVSICAVIGMGGGRRADEYGLCRGRAFAGEALT